MTRLMQVKKLRTRESYTDHVASLGADLPLAAPGAEQQVLGAPTEIVDPAGRFAVANRFAILPMEGWDGTTDGRPSELTTRRWDRFATSGAGLVWGEATAVIPEGRANPNQLVIDESTIDDLAALRARLDPTQVSVLQLTHSGRYCRPTDAGLAPRTAYPHPLLDGRVGAGSDNVLDDDDLDELSDIYLDRARLAAAAGFDFVDVKACHGYLGHELLSATTRAGRYGGDYDGRTHFLRSTIGRIRDELPELGMAVRLSIFDFAPHSAGADGSGVCEVSGGYEHAFGGDGSGQDLDLTETHRLVGDLTALGVGLLSATAGSPYYVPHIQRPAYFPPSDGYLPPEDPLIGVARLAAATAELTRAHPNLQIVGGGLSYLQQWLPAVGAGLVESGAMDLVGLGRMVLSYPHLPRDVLDGADVNERLICRTFSDCTTAPRGGMVSGCYPLDDFYKQRPERVELAAFKKRTRIRRG